MSKKLKKLQKVTFFLEVMQHLGIFLCLIYCRMLKIGEGNMLNIVIVHSNISFSIYLMNYLNNRKENVKVCAILKDSEQTISILNKNRDIDIVIVEFNLVSEILEQMENLDNIEKYRKTCIVIADNEQDTSKIKTNSMIYSIVTKSTKLLELFQKINKLIEYKEKEKNDNELRGKITEELLYLGYDISRKGTRYLVETINYVAINYDKYLENLERDVYPEVSKKYQDSVLNVKYNINRVNNAMYCECEVEKLKDYFCFENDEKPRTKTVINTVVNKVYNR